MSALVVALAVGLLVAVASPRVAWAQDDPARAALARSLFDEGVAALDAGRLEEAEDRFRRSLAIRSATSVRFNLALVLEQRGRIVESVELLRRAAADDDAPDEIRADARSRAAAIERRVAHVRIELDHPEGVEILLDDRALDAVALGVRIPVDPGRHQLRVTRGGETLLDRTLILTDGGLETVRVESSGAPLEHPVEGGSHAPVPPSVGGDGALLGAGIALLGAGALAGIAAGVTGGLALDRYDTLDAGCDAARSCPASLAPVRDEYQTFATANTVLLPVAITVGAVGVVLLVLGASAGGDEPVVVGPAGLGARF